MKLKKVAVLVYGLGLSGLETVKFLQKRGANVFIFDDNSNIKLQNTRWFDVNDDINKIKYAVVSPGIGDTELMLRLKANNVKIFGEFKFACQFLKKKMIAVSGTNGKTTTVTLLGKILNDAGKKTFVCGNVGTPLISCIEKQKQYKYFVCEISSFQLEYAGEFSPYISVLLNVQQDHLERHKTFKHYQDLKFSIFEHQKNNSFAVVNQNLKNKYMLYGFKKKPTTFSAYKKADACIVDDDLIYKSMSLNKNMISLRGAKNFENILACMIVANICRLDKQQVEKSICLFDGLPHRVQFVRELNGVKYFDDSKATNPDSTNCALEMFEKNVILLMGGYDKRLDFSSIFLNKNIKAVIAFGQARDIVFSSAFDGGIGNLYKCTNLKDAILKAYEIAEMGDTVLLSPACSSFDEFENFEERGKFFLNFVNGL